MGQPSFFDNVREWIGGVAFAVYLWSARMTKEEFWVEQDRQAVEHLRAVDATPTSAADNGVRH